MKAPFSRIVSVPLVACFGVLIAFGLQPGAASASDEEMLPIGRWQVTFVNGVVETVEIRDDGSVLVSEDERKASGRASLVDGGIELRFEDDRVERWSYDSDPERLTVQHWYPASSMPDRPPVLGNAAREDAPAAELEVHEWGTFTVLQGSDGQVIPWYQAPDKLVDLPPFVRQSIVVMGKSGTAQGMLDTVRMETPVLYFYPEGSMDVTVSATFTNGRITEIFPPAFRPGFGGPTTWHGTLLPPDSPERSLVPVATGPEGRHYAAAREVPDAWLFRNRILTHEVLNTTDASDPAARLDAALISSQLPGSSEPEAPVEPIDHFIFYRGAGQHSFHELRAAQGADPDHFVLSNYGGETIPRLFALRVRDGQSSWVALDSLKKVDYQDGVALNQQAFNFPAPMGAAAEVAADLRTAMIESLHTEGLTRDEAAAMVATWDDLWFTEPGTRILAILPQSFADQMVPLSITPKPTKLERVFVARVEILTREVEEQLTDLLTSTLGHESGQPVDAEAMEAFNGLELGRYSAGGMERALQLLEWRMRSGFARIERAVKEAEEAETGAEGKLATADSEVLALPR